jgi:hypothetical protein
MSGNKIHLYWTDISLPLRPQATSDVGPQFAVHVTDGPNPRDIVVQSAYRTGPALFDINLASQIYAVDSGVTLDYTKAAGNFSLHIRDAVANEAADFTALAIPNNSTAVEDLSPPVVASITMVGQYIYVEFSDDTLPLLYTLGTGEWKVKIGDIGETFFTNASSHVLIEGNKMRVKAATATILSSYTSVRVKYVRDVFTPGKLTDSSPALNQVADFDDLVDTSGATGGLTYDHFQPILNDSVRVFFPAGITDISPTFGGSTGFTIDGASVSASSVISSGGVYFIEVDYPAPIPAGNTFVLAYTSASGNVTSTSLGDLEDFSVTLTSAGGSPGGPPGGDDGTTDFGTLGGVQIESWYSGTDLLFFVPPMSFDNWTGYTFVAGSDAVDGLVDSIEYVVSLYSIDSLHLYLVADLTGTLPSGAHKLLGTGSFGDAAIIIVDESTDIITTGTPHGLNNGDIVQYDRAGGSDIGGITEGEFFTVLRMSDDEVKLMRPVALS